MSDVFRKLWRTVDALGPLIAIGLFVVVLLIVKAEAHRQLLNRATNVEAWCGGINGSRDYNRRFVREVTHGRIAYTLTDLPCEELIRKTLESPKHRGPITARDHPLVYRVLHERRTR